MYRFLTLQSSNLCYILISQLLVLSFPPVLIVTNGAKGLGVVAPKKRNLPNRYNHKYENFKLIGASSNTNHLFCPVNNRGLLTRKFVFSAGLV